VIDDFSHILETGTNLETAMIVDDIDECDEFIDEPFHRRHR